MINLESHPRYDSPDIQFYHQQMLKALEEQRRLAELRQGQFIVFHGNPRL